MLFQLEREVIDSRNFFDFEGSSASGVRIVSEIPDGVNFEFCSASEQVKVSSKRRRDGRDGDEFKLSSQGLGVTTS